MMLRSALVVLTLLTGTAIHAAETENLYQVEVIIFERAVRSSSEDVETWPKNLELHYPDNWIRLLSPEDTVKLANSLTAPAVDDFSLSEDFLRSIGEDAKNAAKSPQNGNEVETQNTEQSVKSVYYQFLANDRKTLTDSKRGLDRTGNLRTLFHETWLQPMTDAKAAPALVIQAGNLFGDHHELEGYITLSVSRYLHIQTDLWFSAFIPNYGQPSQHWPPLPEFPTTLRSELVTPEVESPKSDLFPKADAFDLTRFSPPPAGDELQLDDLNLEQSDYNQLLAEPYIINETITLRQKRRMRSRELHYIDHPRLGLLIKLTPIARVDIAHAGLEIN